MPLGARDIMMVVRARDLASRTLRNIGNNMGNMATKQGALANQLFNIGSAMSTVGLGMAAVGAVGVTWMDNSTDAAIKYNNEARKTMTQMDGIKSSLEEVKDIARDVAREIPAPFEQMQESLYDIFSSMDVNVAGSKTLLREFSRAAVAGQVDLSDATRGTIGILNAYGMEVEDVHRVNDIMFQLVRKGVGTYAEFNSTIGLAVPAAVRAGQGIETVAGMMAFMTRNGISASRSASSAMRALENLSDPRIVKRLENMGVSVKDAAGEFLPMADVVGQLGQKLEGLPGPEKSAVLQELLKGAGNSAQARRFWNLAITNYDEFQQRVDEMIDSGGAMADAYKIMFEDPQVQIQLLKNQYEILRTEIGDELLPIKLKLAQAAMKVLDAWNGLDDGTKSLIIKIVAISSAFMVFAGIALTVVGGLTALVAIIMSMGIGFGAAVGILAGFLGVLAALPVVAFLLITHWETLVGWAKQLWEWFKNLSDFVKPLVAGFAAFALAGYPIVGVLAAIVTAIVLLWQNWDTIFPLIVAGWGKVQEAASTVWRLMQRFWDWLSGAGVKAWHKLVDAWDDFIGAIKKGWKWFDDKFGKGFQRIFGAIGKEVPAVLREVIETFIEVGEHFNKYVVQPLLAGINWIQGAFERFRTAAEFAWIYIRIGIEAAVGMIRVAFDILVEIIQFAMTVIGTRVEIAVGIIVAWFRNFGGTIIDLVTVAWNSITRIIENVIKIISNAIQLFLNIIQGDWGEAWDNVKNILSAAWDLILNAIVTYFDAIKIFFTQMPSNIVGFIGEVGRLLFDKGRQIIRSLWQGMGDIIDSVWQWIRRLGGRIQDSIPNPLGILFEIGRMILKGLWEGMKDVWEDTSSWLEDVAMFIPNLKGPPAKDAVLLVDNGKLVMQGFQKGLIKGWTDVKKTLGGMTDSLSPNFNINGAMSGTNGNGPVNPVSGAAMIVQGDLVVREEQVVDDMDWFARTRLSGV